MRAYERLINYVKYETTSNANSDSSPSTKNQIEFANILKKEMLDLGLLDVKIDINGYLTGFLPSNINDKKNLPTIGFLSHLDTAPSFTAKNVKPNIIKNYNGQDIVLNSEVTLKIDDFPEILDYIGQDLITTDGNTLLGADDKAGIAEILTAIEFLIQNPHIKRPNIKIAFTPDEEIGRGCELLNIEDFGADLAYTIDGGKIGELQFENFNAAYAKVSIQGQNVHPGDAKDKMINSILLSIRLNDMLPKDETPDKTENYQGFYHICDFNGNEEKSELYYIIRAFDRKEFKDKKQFLLNCIEKINSDFDFPRITIKMKDQYYNMKEKIKPVMYIIEKAKIAMEKAGVTPIIVPIRGGTDGAHLSYKGLPTPNIFTGGHNFHGKFEFIPIQSMDKAVEVIINIVKEYAK